MEIEKDILPDTVDELKALIVNLQNEFQSEKQILLSENKSLNNKINLLEEKLKAAFARFFSPSKDTLSTEPFDQLMLFNETEAHADDNPAQAESANESESDKSDADKTIITYTRKKGGKRRIPDDIPAEEIVYELSDTEKGCKCCGKTRPLIGEDRSEELDIIPAKIKKLVHIVKKYGPCSCEEFLHSGEPEVMRAHKPERFIPYSIVSPDLPHTASITNTITQCHITG